jgi:predicted SAM-dependent methyltransferase
MRKFPFIDFNNEILLDIGCANKKMDGFIGIDNVDYGQEILWDIRDGIPFPDNSVSKVYTSHLMEHLTNKEGKAFTEEVLRVLKSGGIFYSKMPSITHYGAFYPDHESFWNEPRVESLANPDNMPGWEIIVNTINNKNELEFELRKL